ncbi:DUF6493 family protein [Streptomyces sp. JNUCC 64]
MSTTTTDGTAATTAEGTTPEDTTAGELLAAVRLGRLQAVTTLLPRMPKSERRAALPELKALRKELRQSAWSDPSRKSYPALHAAGAGCHSGAADTAAWLAGADMRWQAAPPKTLVTLLSDRDPEWQREVLRRLAERPATARIRYELMAGLAELCGGQPPLTDSYVRGWLGDNRRARSHGVHFTERLAEEPYLVPLVMTVFELQDVGWTLEWQFGHEGRYGWLPSLVELTGKGVLDRASMLDACVARLLRGGRLHDQRVFLKLLEALAPTREERRARVADWTALVADALAPVAGHAQTVLGALALDGDLTPRQIAEMSRGALFRAEKKLVRAQLILLGKVLAASPDAAVELLPAVTDVFEHEDTGFQERALKLVEKHVGRVDGDTRAGLLGAAGRLSPSLRARAATALGFAPADLEPAEEPYQEYLPPVPEPRRMDPPIGSVAELAEEVSALGTGRGSRTGVAEFERTLEGLVRYARTDREALIEAVRPVVTRRWWYPGKHPHLDADSYFQNSTYGIEVVLATLFGVVTPARLRTSGLEAAITPERSRCSHSDVRRPRTARLWEAARQVASEPPPFLLATPTWVSGLLEPDELVARLAGYRRLGIRPGEADFAQALLRVRRDGGAAEGDPAVGAGPEAAAAHAAAAAALGTPEGDRLARWLSAGEIVPPPTTVVPEGDAGPLRPGLEEVPALLEEFSGAFGGLGLAVKHAPQPGACRHWAFDSQADELATLPGLREVVAARFVDWISQTSTFDVTGNAEYLPALAEAPGPAGPAVHLSVAHGLGAKRGEERIAAVDALLVLAAREQLDTALLGGLLGSLMARGLVKATRAVDSARTAAATGAQATVWAVLREALPSLLEGPARGGQAARGLADLLSVAAECVERSGAGGSVPHLAELAARPGAARLLVQARRLHSLTGVVTAG